MRLKPGVRIHGVNATVVLALVVASDIYDAIGDDMIITSLIDGRHMHGSLHYVGAAVDLRMPTHFVEEIVDELKERLGDQYDVVLESDHIHIEFQPKVGGS